MAKPGGRPGCTYECSGDGQTGGPHHPVPGAPGSPPALIPPRRPQKRTTQQRGKLLPKLCRRGLCVFLPFPPFSRLILTQHCKPYMYVSRPSIKFTETWTGLEIIVRGEVSQKERDKYHRMSLKSGIEENDTNEFLHKAETDPQTQKTNLWLSKGKDRRENLGVWD